MTAVHVDEWVERLKAGTLDVTDLGTVERLHMAEAVDRLQTLFPVQFLERRQRSKWEVGLAQSHRRHTRTAQSAAGSGKAVTETFRHCLFLTGEAERLTTVAAMGLLRARIPSGHERVELTSGAGFSLYRDPDGWKIKLLEERTVALDRANVQHRGWRLATEDAGPG
jgi:hypothetical protein